MEKFETCPGKNITIIKLDDDIKFNLTSYVWSINGHIYINQTIYDPIDAFITISKCDDSNQENCKFISKVTIKKICTLLKLSTGVLKDIADKVEPRVLCPINAVNKQ